VTATGHFCDSRLSCHFAALVCCSSTGNELAGAERKAKSNGNNRVTRSSLAASNSDCGGDYAISHKFLLSGEAQ
jgi:hypothetical protein